MVLLNKNRHRRYRNYPLRYTVDTNLPTICNARIFLDANGTNLTPITPLFLDRVLLSVGNVPKKNPVQMRYILSCINLGNDGVGEFRTPIPYLPGTTEHKLCCKEILTVNNVVSIKYFSEQNDINLEAFL